MFDGEMLIGKLPTTLLELFCKIILSLNFIGNSSLYPDDNFLEELFSNLWVKCAILPPDGAPCNAHS